MSILKEPKPVCIFSGLIYQPDLDLEKVILALKAGLGNIDYESPELEFEGTSYYEEEMGEMLKRKIIGFEKLIPRDKLRDIKLFTTALEKEFSHNGNRTVNIDPGYIAQEHVILATGKAFAHRPYIGKGVYADLTLLFRGEGFETLEWTYPDYGSPKMRELFKNIRDRYEKKLLQS